MKVCSKCKVNKDESCFPADPQKVDGLHSSCKDCKNMQNRSYYANSVDKQYHRERVAKWARENPERLRELNNASHQRRKEKRNAESRKYRAENTEHMRELGKAWSKNNPDKWKITNANRRAKKANATTPISKTELDRFIVSEMYDLSIRRTKSTGIKWHVDHIVPLKSKIVCGLHCSANLQVIPALVNQSKGNRTWPDMP